ncbi:conjugal transfer protein TraD [Luteimonas fraxinea]|uniref:conjugal transfer protein TraD n=1 Tax=Luteimonas fraxinea TaxID=2901869 RepID=UPI001E4F9C86|nr:conjugal transfer protein TraD [Luteimonas fraxinea]MCD9125411.1 conjugal transfer protein TraD [Luteimonas fraxinea]
MGSSKQLYDQIAQATTRLAQLKAKELMAAQREAARHRETARRNEALRKSQLGALVFAAGCEELPDGEIITALLNYVAGHPDREGRARARTAGDAHLAALAAGCLPRKH